jgi:hypothetical protein
MESGTGRPHRGGDLGYARVSTIRQSLDRQLGDWPPHVIDRWTCR